MSRFFHNSHSMSVFPVLLEHMPEPRVLPNSVQSNFLYASVLIPLTKMILWTGMSVLPSLGQAFQELRQHWCVSSPHLVWCLTYVSMPVCGYTENSIAMKAACLSGRRVQFPKSLDCQWVLEAQSRGSGV